MAFLDVGNVTRTSLETSQGEYTSGSVSPENKVLLWDYPDADKYTGQYKKNPYLKKAIDALGNWVTGRGFQADSNTRMTLETVRGYGEQNFLSFVRAFLIQKKVQGDAFAEIVRSPDTGRLVNLKLLYTGDVSIETDSGGMIKGYKVMTGKNDFKKIPVSSMLHSSNDKYANEIRGTSVIECVEWMLDAIMEAMRDYRVVIHRNKIPVRIIEIDDDNASQISSLKNQYEQAIKRGEVLIIPKGTVDFKDNTIQITDPTNWINYLENAIYIAIGVPKVVLGGSSQSTEASAKIDYLTFEEVYNREHEEFESDFYNQVGLRIRFNKPASLQEQVQSSEAANTGQVGFQQNDTQAGVGA